MVAYYEITKEPSVLRLFVVVCFCEDSEELTGAFECTVNVVAGAVSVMMTGPPGECVGFG